MSDTELLPKPKREPGPVHRLEVFTGAGGAAVGPRSRRRGQATKETKAVGAEDRLRSAVPALARNPAPAFLDGALSESP